MSSNYPHKGPSILDTLLIEIASETFRASSWWLNKVIHDSMVGPYLNPTSTLLGIVRVNFISLSSCLVSSETLEDGHFLLTNYYYTSPHLQLPYQKLPHQLLPHSLLPKTYFYLFHFKTNFGHPKTNVNPNQNVAPSNYCQP